MSTNTTAYWDITPFTALINSSFQTERAQVLKKFCCTYLLFKVHKSNLNFQQQIPT